MVFLPNRIVDVAPDADLLYDDWLTSIAERLDTPDCDRRSLCRTLLTEIHFPHLTGVDPTTLPHATRVALAHMDPENVTLELSEFQFEPAALVFREGVPTRLTLRNVGDRTHTFVSERFFKAIAAQKLVSAAGEVSNPYVETIEVPSVEEKQLYFLPVAKGTYPLECSILLHDIFGMEGQITIE